MIKNDCKNVDWDVAAHNKQNVYVYGFLYFSYSDRETSPGVIEGGSKVTLRRYRHLLGVNYSVIHPGHDGNR